MRYNPYYDRFLADEQQRLLRELGSQKMSWRKLGKIIRLGMLVRMHDKF